MRSLKKQHKHTIQFTVERLVLPGRLDILQFLSSRGEYITLDEISSRLREKFSESVLFNSLTELALGGLVEKRVINNLVCFRITSKGKQVVEKYKDLKVSLET